MSPKENVVVFEGYIAAQIELQAERAGKTPQEYVLSFFDTGCNAPTETKEGKAKEGVKALPLDRAASF